MELKGGIGHVEITFKLEIHYSSDGVDNFSPVHDVQPTSSQSNRRIYTGMQICLSLL